MALTKTVGNSAFVFAIYIAIRSDGKGPGAYPGACAVRDAYPVPKTPIMTSTAKSICYPRFNRYNEAKEMGAIAESQEAHKAEEGRG